MGNELFNVYEAAESSDIDPSEIVADARFNDEPLKQANTQAIRALGVHV